MYGTLTVINACATLLRSTGPIIGSLVRALSPVTHAYR